MPPVRRRILGINEWEKQSVSHVHNPQSGIGGIRIIAGTAIIVITAISARG